MEAFEQALLASLKKCLPWSWKSLRLLIDLDDGSYSPSGSVERFLGTAVSINELRWPVELSQSIFNLGQRSRDGGAAAIYSVELLWERGGTPAFLYRREESRVKSLSEVRRNVHGQLPMFMFRSALDTDLVKELAPKEVIYAIQTFVHAQRDKRPINPRLLEITDAYEWMGAVGRGGSDSYFLQGDIYDRPITGADTLRRIRSGLLEQGENELAALFDESLRVYASEVSAALVVCQEAEVMPKLIPSSNNDADVNRITAAVQSLDMAWMDRIGKRVQVLPERYLAS